MSLRYIDDLVQTFVHRLVHRLVQDLVQLAILKVWRVDEAEPFLQIDIKKVVKWAAMEAETALNRSWKRVRRLAFATAGLEQNLLPREDGGVLFHSGPQMRCRR